MFDRFDTSPHDMMERIDPTEEVFIGDLDAPTVDRADPLEQRLRRALDELGDHDAVSTTLPISARDAFESFCDLEATPLWVSVIKSVKVVAWNPAGRAKRAAYLARLERATIGYTLHYRYDEYRHLVTWGTAPGTTTVIAGRAQFEPLGDRACRMHYQLDLELPLDALPPWEDPFFTGHAASVVLNDFRDYVLRRRH